MISFKAYEFLAKDRAGLQLCGMEDGQLQWMGTFYQWQQVDKEEQKILSV
jgi:hypothetical protein